VAKSGTKVAGRGAAAKPVGRAKGKAARSSDGQQETVLSFRVDHHLAEALNRLPDRSGFIRKAILRAFYRVCPACQGKGVLPETAALPIEAFIAKNLTAKCQCCGFAYPESEMPKRGALTCKDCAEHEHAGAHAHDAQGSCV